MAASPRWTPERRHPPPLPELLGRRRFLRYVLHLDYPPLSRARTRWLDRALRATDYDFPGLGREYGVFSDGVRARWRKPLLELRDILDIVRRAGVEHVRGYWLPTGWRCGPCYPPEDGCPPPPLGDAIACDGHPLVEDWWECRLVPGGIA